MADGFPSDLRYSESDEWVRTEGDEAVIGVTSFAAEQLGDVVYLQLPDVGKTVGRDEAFGEIESVKAVSELISPIAGEVLAVNTDLENSPNLVNDDPYGGGWIARLRPSDPGEVGTLLDAEAYERSTAERG